MKYFGSLSLVLALFVVTTSEAAGFGDLSQFGAMIQKPIEALQKTSQVAQGELAGEEERTFTDYFLGGHKYVNIISDKKTGNILDCYVIGDREFISFMIGDNPEGLSEPVRTIASASPQQVIINATTAEVDQFIDQCNKNHTDDRPPHRKITSDLNPIKALKAIGQYIFIFPGTKWCGAGDVSKNYDDLGPAMKTDMCCRDHDHALDGIPRGAEKYGLKNDLLYTMTKCEADTKFSECLTSSATITSSAVGTLYFNVLKTKCFDLKNTARCAKRLIPGISPCKQYTFDEATNKTWQIFDPAQFTPNSSVPVQKISEALHSMPGFAEAISVLKFF